MTIYLIGVGLAILVVIQQLYRITKETGKIDLMDILLAIVFTILSWITVCIGFVWNFVLLITLVESKLRNIIVWKK